MSRNARFWVWWHDGWVKLTLRPDQSVEAGYNRTTDEGWCSWRERWSFDGDKVTREAKSDGVDCDGRLTRFHTDECHVYQLAVVPHQKQTPWIEGVGCEFVDDPDAPLTPDWQNVSASQRDQYAEMAGY